MARLVHEAARGRKYALAHGHRSALRPRRRAATSSNSRMPISNPSSGFQLGLQCAEQLRGRNHNAVLTLGY